MLTTPPFSSHPFTYRFPRPTTYTLGDGTPVYAVDVGATDITSVTVYMRRGSAHDLLTSAPLPVGATAMAMEMLTRGTVRDSFQEFADRVESLGAQVRASAGRTHVQLTAVGLVEHGATLVDLVADCITTPRMDPDEFEAVQEQWISEAMMDASDPMWLAGRALSRASFPDHPYRMPNRGTSLTLRELTLDAVHAAYQHLLSSPRSIVVTGTLPSPAMLERFEAMAHLLKPADDYIAVPAPIVPERHACIAVYPEAVQTALAISLPGPRYLDPDFAAVRLISTVLGGHTLARLFTILREQKGYTYGAYAGVDVLEQWGAIDISTSVGSEYSVDTIQTIRDVLEEIATVAISEQELQDARQHLLGVYARSTETAQQVGSTLWRLLLHGLPFDYDEQLVASLQRLTVKDLLPVQQRWFSPHRWVVGACGDADVVRRSLEAHVDEIEVWTPEDVAS